MSAVPDENAVAGLPRPFDEPRSYLVATSREPLAAAVAVRSWPNGPPDLCVTSPSGEARDTAAFAADDDSVTIFDEPLLASRRPAENPQRFSPR